MKHADTPKLTQACDTSSIQLYAEELTAQHPRQNTTVSALKSSYMTPAGHAPAALHWERLVTRAYILGVLPITAFLDADTGQARVFQ